MSWFWPPKVTFYPTPTSCPQFLGVPVASQPPSQHQPTPASQSASQPAAIQCTSNSVQSSCKLPESPSSPAKALKAKGFHRFLLCQPGRLQHQLSMPKPSKVTPSDPQGQSRSSEGDSKCSLEEPKVTPNSSIWSHGAQFEPNVNPEAPKIHRKTSKMLPK